MQLSFQHRLRCLLLFLCLCGGFSIARAQTEDGSDLDLIEAELEKSTPAEPPPPREEPVATNVDPQTLSDLSKLAPFSEVSVLQKRFMPKTKRFQFNLGLGGIMNDPWFYGLGGSIRAGYHFTEAWSLEGTYSFLSSSERDAAKDLLANNSVGTSSLVTTKGYMGVDVVWTPIYGKMSLYNQRIIPFDMYFALGGGQSEVDGANSKTVPTLHLGTGQIYALGKSWGFRWDFSWNTFSATQTVGGVDSSTTFNNLILTLGASFFFPEVRYR